MNYPLTIAIVVIGFLLKKIVESHARKVRFQQEFERILKRHSTGYGSLRNDPDILFPNESDSLIEARKVFGLFSTYTREQVLDIYRRSAKEFHPDKKGDCEAFVKFTECKDILLNNI